MGSIPGQGTKIPHATEKLSPSTIATELEHHNQRVCALQEKILHADATKTPCGATKT